MLGGDRADAVAGGIVDGHRVDEAQAERALRDEPGFVAFEAIFRQLGGTSSPGQRPPPGAYAVTASSTSLVCATAAACAASNSVRARRPRRRWLAATSVPASATLRAIVLQAARHHAKRPADVALDARAHRRVVRPQDEALGDAAGRKHREHADQPGQRDACEPAEAENPHCIV